MPLEDYERIFPESMHRLLFRPEEEKIDYGKASVPIGKRLDGSCYTLSLKDCLRIAVIAETRAGKTYFLRAMTDRLKESGFYAVLFLNDCKDEAKSSRKPVQKKFQKGLLEGEKPKGMKTLTFRPTFFKQTNHELPEGNVWLSPRMQDMTKADFLTLVNYADMTPAQKTEMDLLFPKLKEYFLSEKDKCLSDFLDKAIDGIKEISESQRSGLKRRLQPLKDSHFHEPEHEHDVSEGLRKGFTIAINMEGFDSFGKSSFAYPEVVLGIILRGIVTSRRAGTIPRTWVVIDESPRVLPTGRETSFKSLTMESVDIDTRYWLAYAFAGQHIEKMPKAILDQCRYILVPRTAKTEMIQFALERVAVIKNPWVAKSHAQKWKKAMRRHEYSWLIVDMKAPTSYEAAQVIIPLCPLSAHQETA